MNFNLKKYTNSGFVKNVSIYLVGAFFLKGISFFLLPVYTSVLTPSEFGVLEIINTIIALLGVVFAMGLIEVIMMNFYHFDFNEKAKMIGGIIFLYFIVILPVTILVSILFFWKEKLIFGSEIGISLVLIISGTIFLNFFSNLYLNVLKISGISKRLTLVQVIAGIFTALLNIILVYYFRLGIFGIIITNFLSMILICLFGYFHFVQKISFSFIGTTYSKSVEYIKLGFPLILSPISGWLLSYSDRWFILHYANEHQLGIYSIAYKFGSLTEALLIVPVVNSYQPMMLKRLSEKNTNQNLIMVASGIVLIFGVMTVLMPVIAEFIIDQSYYESLELIPFVMVKYGFWFLNCIVSVIPMFMRKARQQMQIILTVTVLNLTLNYLLIPEFGAKGAIISSVVSYGLWFVILQVYSAKLKKEIV